MLLATVGQCLCHAMSSCKDTCSMERMILKNMKSVIISNTEQMEAGLAIQLIMVFWKAMMFIKR